MITTRLRRRSVSGCRALAGVLRKRPRLARRRERALRVWVGETCSAFGSPDKLDAAGLPRRRIYDLRHTAISHWLAADLGSFEVARLMGTSVRMVDLTYGHLVSGSELDARTRLDEWAKSVPRDRAAQYE